MPLHWLQVLRGRLVVDAERGRPSAHDLLAELDGALAAHLELVAHDTPDYAPSGQGGGQGQGLSGGWLHPGLGVR